jgi:hypothetical protein
MKLTVELIPQSSFFQNVRSEVSRAEWDRLRKQTYQKAGYKCEICGGKGKQHPVECHEVWEFNEFTHIQRLVRMIALCPMCHKCKHIGLAQMMGFFDQCVEHMMKVNETTEEETQKYIDEQIMLWRKRSEEEWQLDLRYLDELNKKEENSWLD